MKNSASFKSIDELFWQLKACENTPDREQLLAKIRNEQPDQAHAVEVMLANEANLGEFMALPDEPSEFTGGVGDQTLKNGDDCHPHESGLDLTLDSQPEPNAVQQRKVSATKFPKQIGPYKLLEPIGEGGMGVVYLAQQSKPVRRMVALKIIKPGMDSRQVIARFEAERQALAMMDHPHIAKVLDAGTTEAGLPYFVMELVRGIPLTEYCDRAKMPTRARLELFQDACLAIQHAHNKGVIHRDVKPSNVLVTEQDGKPLVKVIDFGVAKALTDNLTDKTLFTGMFQLLGTPLYMSPEQASLSNVDVDTRSDVYSLGVMLYELLSGSLPIDREEVKGLSLEQLRQRICDTEPPRPSKRLSTLKDERETVAERRGVTGKSISRIITSELDWIVMRALEKDRSRRYQSAREFSHDIQRYLDGDAVEACPPSTIYKMQKAYKKNRALIAAASAMFITLSCATCFSSWQAWQATLAKEDAEKQTERADAEAKKALVKAEEAQAISDFMVNGIFKSALPGEETSITATIGEVLDNADRNLRESFEDQPLIEAAVRDSLGDIYRELELHLKALDQYSEAIALMAANKNATDKALLSLRMNRALALCHGAYDFDSVKTELLDIISICESASPPVPKTHLLTAKADLGSVLNEAGAFENSVAVLEPVVEECRAELGNEHALTILCVQRLASAYLGLNDREKSIAIMREAVADLDAAGLQTKFAITIRFNLASRLVTVSPEESLEILERCSAWIERAHGRESLVYAKLVLVKGQARWRLGDEAIAEEHFLEAIRIAENLSGTNRWQVAKFSHAYADFLLSEKRYKEARNAFKRAYAESEVAFGKDHPETLNLLGRLAAVEYDRGNEDVFFTIRYQILARLKSRYTTRNDEWKGIATHTLVRLIASERWQEVETLFKEFLQTGAKPSDRIYVAEGVNAFPTVICGYERLFDHYVESGRNTDAECLMDEYIEALKIDRDSEALTMWVAQRQRAEAIVAQKRFEEGLEELEKVYQFAIDQNLDDRLEYTRNVLRDAYQQWANEMADGSKAGDAALESAIDLTRKAVETYPSAIGWHALGLLYFRNDQWQNAEDAFVNGRDLEDQGKRHQEYRVPWALAKAELGELEEAIAMYDLASLELMARIPEPDSWMPRHQAALRKEVGRTLKEELAAQLSLAKLKATEEPANYFYRTAWQKLLWLSYLQDPMTVGEQHFQDARRFYEELDPAIRIEWALSLLPLGSMKGQDDRSVAECVVLIAQASKQIGELKPMAASHIVRLSSLHSETAKHQSLFPLAEKSSQAESPIPAHLYAMGLWELHNGTPAQAVEWFEKSQRLADESDRFEPAIAAMLSVAHHRLGNDDQADEWLERSNISREQVNSLHPHTIAEWDSYRRVALDLSKQRQAKIDASAAAR